jgi:hypothetical protein
MTRFPVGIICAAASTPAVGSEKIAVAHASALAAAGYPVRILSSSVPDPSDPYVTRSLSELSPAHPRVAALREERARGAEGDGFETCVQDLAQSIGRELVGCGSVFVHDFLTSDLNPVATEAIWRLAQGSRGIVAQGAPIRRWIVFAHEPGPGRSARARGPRAAHDRRMPLARYATGSEARRAALAKQLGIARSEIRVVPHGVDPAAELELTPNVVELARAGDLFAADLVMLTPARALDRKGLSRGLEIARAILRARRSMNLRWIVTVPHDAQEPAARRTLDRLLVERERLDLVGTAFFLSVDFPWARPRTSDADVRALRRLCGVLFLPSSDAGFGSSVIEGAVARQTLVVGPAPALRELAPSDVDALHLAASDTPAVAARRILASTDASPGLRLRRRVMREMTWDAIARNHLVPLINED